MTKKCLQCIKTPCHPYLSTNLVFSVFPAPDSPETMMDWLIFRTFMSLYALSAGWGDTDTVRLDSALPQGHRADPIYLPFILFSAI